MTMAMSVMICVRSHADMGRKGRPPIMSTSLHVLPSLRSCSRMIGRPIMMSNNLGTICSAFE